MAQHTAQTGTNEGRTDGGSSRLVVVGVDGSEGGRRALTWAVRHAAATGAAVEAVTAYSWTSVDWTYPEGRADEMQYVREQQNADIEAVLVDVAEPLTVSRVVVEGRAVDVLTASARTADLLVVGSHGRSHLATALLGSVSEGCIRRGSTPVVVVPAHDPADRAEALVPAPTASAEG